MRMRWTCQQLRKQKSVLASSSAHQAAKVARTIKLQTDPPSLHSIFVLLLYAKVACRTTSYKNLHCSHMPLLLMFLVLSTRYQKYQVH